MNQVQLLGRLTKDPELKYTTSGKAFLRISIAVPQERDKTQANFINCVAWNKPAEIIAEHFKKGNRINLVGKLTSRQYEDAGVKKWITEVMIDSFDFIEKPVSTGVSISNSTMGNGNVIVNEKSSEKMNIKKPM